MIRLKSLLEYGPTPEQEPRKWALDTFRSNKNGVDANTIAQKYAKHIQYVATKYADMQPNMTIVYRALVSSIKSSPKYRFGGFDQGVVNKELQMIASALSKYLGSHT